MHKVVRVKFGRIPTDILIFPDHRSALDQLPPLSRPLFPDSWCISFDYSRLCHNQVMGFFMRMGMGSTFKLCEQQCNNDKAESLEEPIKPIVCV
jgi:hypothetical protein